MSGFCVDRQRRCFSQLHLCFGDVFAQTNAAKVRKIFNLFKGLRKEHGVESVNIILATNALIGTLGENISFKPDGFHCGGTLQRAICLTRYPTHPRGYRSRGRIVSRNHERYLQYDHQFRKRLLREHGRQVVEEHIVEINCVAYVVPSVVQKCSSILSGHD